MTTVKGNRVERITCDEEERTREGYEVVTHYRFATGTDGLPILQRAVAAAGGGEAMAELLFAPQANLWRINRRWKRAEQKGFTLGLSYSNQMDHPRLDRFLVRDYLMWLQTASTTKVTLGRSYEEQYKELLNKRDPNSNFEAKFLKALHDTRRHLPMRAQYRPEPGIYAEADFFYERDGLKGVAVFIDGPHHDDPIQRRKDTEERTKLEDGGYRVIVIRYDKSIEQQLSSNADVFGPGVKQSSANS